MDGKEKDRKRAYKAKTWARWRSNGGHGKAVSITYSECVFLALLIQHAMRMRFISTYSHMWPLRL